MSFIRSIIAVSSAVVLCFLAQVAEAETTHAATTTAENAAHVTEHTVNINTASVEQLRKVKGIGAAKAKAIVDYRTAHGPFKSVDDLSDVKGFSTKVVANLVKKNPGMMVVG